MRRVLATAFLLLALSATSASAAPGPATFRVGAATASLDPPVPVYSGGFGMSPPITKVHDPLQVRAIYVSNGKKAVAMAVVDAQAMFGGYQEGDFGITDARERAAAAIGGGM